MEEIRTPSTLNIMHRGWAAQRPKPVSDQSCTTLLRSLPGAQPWICRMMMWESSDTDGQRIIRQFELLTISDMWMSAWRQSPRGCARGRRLSRGMSVELRRLQGKVFSNGLALHAADFGVPPRPPLSCVVMCAAMQGGGVVYKKTSKHKTKMEVE